MSQADDDFLDELIDESAYGEDMDGGAGMAMGMGGGGYGHQQQQHHGHHQQSAGKGSAAVSSRASPMASMYLKGDQGREWSQQICYKVQRAFAKLPFAAQAGDLGLAEVSAACEDGEFETVDEFAKEVRHVLGRWISGDQVADGVDAPTQQFHKKEAGRALAMFEQVLADEVSRLRQNNNQRDGGHNSAGKRKDDQTGGDWDQSEDNFDDEEDDGSNMGQDEESEDSQDDIEEDSSDEFTLHKRPTRSRKPPPQEAAVTTSTSTSVMYSPYGFLNTSEGSLNRRFAAHVLNEIYKRKHYNFTLWFTEPVDTNLVPDYLDIVSDPMDLSTIKKKWGGGAYDKSFHLFESDILLMLKNCYNYNGMNSPVSEAAKKLENLFEEMLAKKDEFYEDPNSPEFSSTSSDPRVNKMKAKPRVGGSTPNKGGGGGHSKGFDWENAIKACEQCGTKSSPEWRRVVMDDQGPNGEEVVKMLCNACGLRIVRARRKAAQSGRKTVKTVTGHVTASQLLPASHYQDGQSGREDTPTLGDRKVKRARYSPPPISEDLGDRKAKKAAVAAVAAVNKPQPLTQTAPPPKQKDQHRDDYGSHSESFDGTRILSSTRVLSTTRKPLPGYSLDGLPSNKPKSILTGGKQQSRTDNSLLGKKRKLDNMEDGGDHHNHLRGDLTPETEHSGSGYEYAALGARLRELERQNMDLSRNLSETRRELDQKTRSLNALRGEVTTLASQLAEKTLVLEQMTVDVSQGAAPKEALQAAEELKRKLAVVAEVTMEREIEDKVREHFMEVFQGQMTELTEKAAKAEAENKQLTRDLNETKVKLEEASQNAALHRREVELLSVDVAAGGAAAASAKLIEMLRKDRFEAVTEAETLREALKTATKEAEEWQAKFKAKSEGGGSDEATAVATSSVAAPEHKDILEQTEVMIREFKETKAALESAEADRERLRNLLRGKMTDVDELQKKLKERETENANLTKELAKERGKVDSVRAGLAAVRANANAEAGAPQSAATLEGGQAGDLEMTSV